MIERLRELELPAVPSTRPAPELFRDGDTPSLPMWVAGPLSEVPPQPGDER